MRIWSPIFAYCPQTTVSALLNSDDAAHEGGIDVGTRVIRRSESTGAAVRRNCAQVPRDWPMSVLSMSRGLGRANRAKYRLTHFGKGEWREKSALAGCRASPVDPEKNFAAEKQF